MQKRTKRVEGMERRSVASAIIEAYLWTTFEKSIYASKRLFHRYVDAIRIIGEVPYRIPELKFIHYIDLTSENDMDTYVINGGKESGLKLLYLHGGAYINQPIFPHWEFLFHMAGKLSAKVFLPIYPKVPFHTCEEAYDKLIALYKTLLSDTDPKNIVIMGDSAGGGLSLGLAMKLNELSLPQPRDIIMLSPWLDVSMSNPIIPAYDKLDPMLGIYGLKELGQMWAGELGVCSSMASPIYGDVRGLGRLTLFVGTHEILLPDAQRFFVRAQAHDVPLNYFEWPKMNHVFPLFPIPERKQAIELMLRILREPV